MKKLQFILIVFCLLISSGLHAQMDWIDFQNNGEGGQEPHMIMVNDSTFRVDFFGTNRFREIVNDTTYDVLKLTGMNGKTIDIGLPELPLKACYFEIAIDTPSIAIVSEDYIVLDSFNIMPAQEPLEQDTVYQFEKNDSLYTSNGFYPSCNSRISMPQTLREHKISSLVFYPIQFNPVSRQLRVYKHIEVIVHGAGSIESEKDNAYFDSYLDGLIINYEKNNTPDEIIDLLVITPDEYYSSLLPFKEWKEKAGIRTKIVTRSAIEAAGYPWIADPVGQDWSYQGIDAYIKDYYNNVTGLTPNTPEFLLFVGETDTLTPEMPTHYWQYLNNDGYWVYSPTTDLYYTTMDISELSISSNYGLYDLPDMFSGRISVDNIQELEIVLNKIINYEQNPYLEQTDWYNRINLSSYFEAYLEGIPISSDCDCREFLYFIYTSNSVYDYLFQKNYNINRVFYNNWLVEHPDDILCTYWLEHLPTSIPYYLYETDATNAVIESINNGCFLVNHVDHGQSRNKYNYYDDGWQFPPFNQNHINLLTNDKILPVMFDMDCQTGWFDGGSDNINWPSSPGNFDCLGEMLLSKENGGVVGFIGATRNAKAGYTDELCYGLYDAIWDDFDPYNNEIQTPIYKLGAIKDYGLLYSLNKYYLGNATTPYEGLIKNLEFNRKHIEEFHVLGDPTLEMWTGVPQPLFTYVDYDQQLVTVYDDNNEVIPGAKVVLQHDEDYVVLMTDANGQVWSPVLSNIDVEVSALKHNYIPWYSTKITDNVIWNAEEEVRGNIIVSNGGTHTFSADVIIPKYARIIIENGGTLNVQSNVTINFGNGYCGILAYGNLTSQQYSTFTLATEGEATNKADIELKNANLNYSFDYLTLRNCLIKGDPYLIAISNSDLIYSGIETERGNATIQSSIFDISFVKIKNASGDNKLVNISENCTFTGNGQITAVGIDNYPNFTIDNCTFRSNGDVINLYNCGYGTHEQQISNCQIYENAGSGIILYRTSADILNNSISANLYGIKCFDRSTVHIEGDHHEITQQISDNISNEVYASRGSFPQYFHWNLIQDMDNLPGDPLVKYAGFDGYFDITYNCWDQYFIPMYDLEPTLCFDWDPKWICNQGAGSGSGSDAEEIYLEAREKIEDEDFTSAKSDFEVIVAEYPESEYAKAAMKELLPLEVLTGNNYTDLKAYYDSDSTIQNNEELAKLADFLANFCDIELENYPIAIAWFEDVIQNPESMEDSIFAIIDLGYTYFLMENGQKSSYVGNMLQYKPVSVEQFEENRDYLLSLLPGDKLSETMKQSINALKTGELLQNVPNPFNHTTQIWYKLDEEATVSISVFDYTGKRVSTINPGTKDKGSHFIEFASDNLPSGIYFYTLEVNGKLSDSKKMTIMK